MITKKCTGCKKELPLSSFGNYSKGEYGVKAECRDCKNVKSRTYRKTKKGLISTIYSSQQSNSRKRKQDHPSYSLQEFKNWILSKDSFHKMYDEWVESGYDLNKKPSVDRIKPMLPYRWDNIQLVSYEFNFKKALKDKMSGKDTRTLVPVVQITMDGEFVREYYSMRQAARDMGVNSVNIVNCCSGKYNSSCGYKWMKKEEWEIKKR